MPRFQCTSCAGSVAKKDGALVCEACGWSASIQEGVVRAVPDLRLPATDGDAPRPSSSPDPGAPGPSWAKWFYDHQASLPGAAPAIYRSAFDPRSGCGIYFSRMGPQGRVLDLSSGLGGITRLLARISRHVVTVSDSLERLLLLKDMMEEEGGGDLVWMQVDPGERPPLAPHQFELVVVGDLLDQIRNGRVGKGKGAVGDRTVGPAETKEAVRTLLTELGRFLIPGGALLVGAPNRWAYRRFVSGRRMKPPPQGLSPREYRAVFGESGYASVDLLPADPDHRFPDEVHPLRTRGSVAYPHPAGVPLKVKIKKSGPFLRNLQKSFFISATSGDAQSGTFLGGLLEELEGQTGLGPLGLLTFSSSWAGIMSRVSGPEGDYVLRGGLHRDQRGRVSRNAGALQALAERGTLQEGEDRSLFPRLRFVGEVGKHLITLEDRIGGSPSLPEVVGPNRPRVLPVLLAFLVRLGRATLSEADSDFRRFHGDLARKISDIQSALVDDDLVVRIAESWKRLSEGLSAQSRRTVWTHGDYNLGNSLLAQGKGRVCGVVDWDQHIDGAPPGLDVINLFLALRGLVDPSPRGTRIVALCRGAWTQEEEGLWEQYFAGLGLDPGDRTNLVRTGWINSLWNGIHESSRRLDYSLIQADVKAVLQGVP